MGEEIARIAEYFKIDGAKLRRSLQKLMKKREDNGMQMQTNFIRNSVARQSGLEMLLGAEASPRLKKSTKSEYDYSK